MAQATDVLILGSGLTGLSAAWVLGDRATTLERASRPGGLVRTERFGDYWFDRVVHLLYFQDPNTERRIRALMGDTLAPCPPRAFCETAAGTTLFPFQMNLRGLDVDSRARCLRDLAEVTYRPAATPPKNFEDHLLATFGRTMCDLFLFPYNRKMWKRPLSSLAPSGFTWNITPPDFEKVLKGSFETDSSFSAYNSAGWYPRPAAGAPVRGMEVLASTLAQQATDLRLNCNVESIDPDRRSVTYLRGTGRDARREHIRYNDAILSTMPLPALLNVCEGAPPDLRRACAGLRRNRVLSATISVKGPRPVNPGHWRYYADESLVFTRLIYLNEFDPNCSPDDGWSLLVEITEPAESPMTDKAAMLARVRADLAKANAIPQDCTIIHEDIILVDPAYVVFGLDSAPIVQAAHDFLTSRGITSLGRYGKWEYSGMSGCIRDGLAWAESLATPAAAPLDLEQPALAATVAANATAGVVRS